MVRLPRTNRAIATSKSRDRACRAKSPVLRLTGERAGRRFLVQIYGKPVHLTHTDLTLLLSLIVACGSGPSGYIESSTSYVCRLRRAIDEGRTSLIETGGDKQYRLAIKPADLRGQILIDEAFFAPSNRRLLSDDTAARLKAICTVVPFRKP